VVYRPVEHHRRDDAGQPEAGNEGSGLPMTMRDAGSQSLTFGRSATKAGHIGGGPRLVDEHERFGIEIKLTVKPGLAPL